MWGQSIVAYRNLKGMVPLSNIILYEGSMGSTCSLIDLLLLSIGLIVLVITWTCIVKMWIGKGMISKHVPPLSGLIGLVVATCCTTNGVASALVLVPISINTKLGGLNLKLREVVRCTCSSSW